MVLYLSSTPHTNLLDFTGWCETDSEMPIKKLVGNYVLKQFVVHDMRNFSHFSELVLDRHAFGDDDTEFAEAIEEFLTMYNARMTVICEGLQQSDPLFTALLNSSVGNIVCDTEITAMQREISECLSETGMTRYNPPRNVKKSKTAGFTITLIVRTCISLLCPPSHAYILCPFVAEESRVDFAEALQNDYHKVLFTEYQLELTNGSVQAKAYKNIIAKYIARV